jgi:NADH:ubiquinone oxidoreductase subunit 6 (subunit J)
MAEILFYILAAMALGGGFGVVLHRSPVGSLLFMVGTLAALAGIFVLL